MDLTQLIESGNYIDEFKKNKVIYRKYPDLNLMIIKRKYGSSYSEQVSWLNFCRGLVIDYKENKLVFCPPSKSKEVNMYDNLSTLGSTFTELIDGTMVNLFYRDQWYISTRSNIGCNNKWSTDINFKQMFDECSPGFDYSKLDTNLTYSFVMRHTKNRNITPVPSNQLYLVDVKRGLTSLPLEDHMNDFYIVNQTISKENLVKDLHPRLFKGLTTSIDGVRYKWITSEYKFIEMIKPNTNNDLLNYLSLRNSGYLSNYLDSFPEQRYTFEGYRKQVHDVSSVLHEFYLNVFVHKQIDKKDIPYALRPLIYDLHGMYLKNKQGISWQDVKNYIYELEPKRLCFVINKLKES